MNKAARLLSLICLSTLFLLPASSATETGSIQSNASAGPEESVKPQPEATVSGPLVADGRDVRVLTRPAPEDWCGSLETTRLVVLSGRREITHRDYCSAYNWGGASLVTDAIGAHYIFLTYGEGHGTHATSTWLKIFRLSEGRYLMERANFLVREPVGIAADQVYDYRTLTPSGGGIVVTGSWIVDDGGYAGDVSLPERDRTIIALDTSPASGGDRGSLH